MALPIVPVGANQSKFWNLLLYAPPGIGKTRFIGTGKNVLIIRPPTDHTDSIREPQLRNIREVVVHGWHDIEQVFEHLQDEGDQYDIVAWDSLSQTQDVGLDELWEKAIAKNPDRKRYGLDKQEYGINMHRLGLYVREIVGLQKFNFIATAHAFWGTNLNDEEMLMPWIQGRNMPEKICGTMNMVGMLEVKSIKLPGEKKAVKRRVIQFGASDRYYAKDQFDAFPKNRLVDPTMETFVAGVEAARARDAVKPKSRKKTGATKKGK